MHGIQVLVDLLHLLLGSNRHRCQQFSRASVLRSILDSSHEMILLLDNYGPPFFDEHTMSSSRTAAAPPPSTVHLALRSKKKKFYQNHYSVSHQFLNRLLDVSR